MHELQAPSARKGSGDCTKDIKQLITVHSEFKKIKRVFRRRANLRQEVWGSLCDNPFSQRRGIKAVVHALKPADIAFSSSPSEYLRLQAPVNADL